MVCPECGLGYSDRGPRDRKRHRLFHDKQQNGVPALLSHHETVIWRGERPSLEMVMKDDIRSDRVIAVTPRSPLSLRKVAGEVARLANLETGFLGGVD